MLKRKMACNRRILAIRVPCAFFATRLNNNPVRGEMRPDRYLQAIPVVQRSRALGAEPPMPTGCINKTSKIQSLVGLDIRRGDGGIGGLRHNRAGAMEVARR